MGKKKYWIAFFSQTGSEIWEIANKSLRFPDVIVTNNIDNINPYLLKLYKESDKLDIIVIDKKPSIADYREILSKYNHALITLHGWLRIIPEEICNEFIIYNGHPGQIDVYPELKGKDPQYNAHRAGKLTYPTVGVVIHRVIGAVDEGDVCMSSSVENDFESFDNMLSGLRKLSRELWLKFLEGKI